MENQPLVSICVPAYNAAATIGDTIQSALDQVYENIEVVVVNDCSRDNTGEVVAGFTDARVRLVENEHNLGINANWQKTILEGRGEYVILLGHDDMLLPPCVERLVDVFSRNPRVGMIGFRAKVVPHGNVTWRPEYGEISPERLKDSLILFTNITPPSEIMYRNGPVKKVGGYDKGYNFCPEVTLAMKLALDGWYSIYLDETLGVRSSYPDRVTAVVSLLVPLKDKLKFIRDYRRYYTATAVVRGYLSVLKNTLRSYIRKLRRSITR